MQMVLETAWGILIPITMLTIVWYGGLLFLHGRIKIGAIFAFNVFVMQLLQPVWQIVSSVSQTQKSLAAMERCLKELKSRAGQPDVPAAVDAADQVEEIRFEQVSFAYRTGTPCRIISFVNVPGGAVVALVGPSGAGKTTLTDLVARFYDPTDGADLP